jgi:hypothetical protein
VSQHPDIEGTRGDSDNEADESATDAITNTVSDDADGHGDPVAATASAEPAAPTVSSPHVARALAELGGLGNLDLGEHPDAYQRIHAELQSALASIDDA